MDQVEHVLSQARRRRGLPSHVERRRLRVRAGLSQRDVAICLGVTPAAVSRYEAGERSPRGSICDRYINLIARIIREKQTA